MSSIAIQAQNLAKRYHISAIRRRHDTLRDALMAALRFPWKQQSLQEIEEQFIWALNGLTFEIPQGESVGIIGHNGAGKSTLLKILSRITRPTSGLADIYGRVGSLLEVGTGFHSELSGRENIYLNGAILGMRKATIDRKFDEIVAFAEVEKFIDTPVKRYSSGMYMRLAFSVAAFLEPDILLVDEVLAVGDLSFQKKCLGKLGEVAEEGRTVLFVSHNMPAIASLTRSCMWLERGKLREFGPTAEVIRHYTDTVMSKQGQSGQEDLLTHPRTRSLPREVEFAEIRLAGEDAVRGLFTASSFQEKQPVGVEVKIRVNKPINWLQLTLNIQTTEGQTVYSVLHPKQEVDLQPGTYSTAVWLKPNHLRPGKYICVLNVHTSVLQDQVNDAILFEIEHRIEGEEYIFWTSDARGVVRFDEYYWEPVEKL